MRNLGQSLEVICQEWIRIARRKSKENLPWSLFLMTVIAATFGALPEVQMMHAIYHFKDHEVNNPMLQTVRNLELKRRSYSHCKSITLSWRKHFAKVLRNHPFVAKWFRSLFEQCDVSPSDNARFMLREGSWEPQGGSQLRNTKLSSQGGHFQFPLSQARHLLDSIA